jgi:hypothetical protein
MFSNNASYKKGHVQEETFWENIKTTLEKKYGPFTQKKTVSETIVVEKKVSRGESKVQEMLRKNREKLKARREAQLTKNKKELARKRKNSQKNTSGDWMSSKQGEVDSWVDDKKAQQKAWEDEKKKTLANWYKKKKQYRKEIPQIKKQLTPIPTVKVEKIINKEVIAPEQWGEIKIVKGAFDIKVGKQGRRPTCAAFAAAKAIELVALKENKDFWPSEQYLYYSFKPNCQQSPCKKRGSWPLRAFNKSRSSNGADIPSRNSCPYSKSSVPGNETQIPLKSGCNAGEVKIQKFREVRGTHEIIEELHNGNPVIGGFKLDDGFYKNNGLLLAKGKGQSLKDAHASGHAFILIGTMALPKKLWAQQGKYCFLALNSWGEGWGLGGRACISQKWFEAYRFPMPFIALNSISF